MGISTLISGMINYCYHPLMIRYLDTTTFGMFQGLLSLFTLMSIISTGISLYITQQFVLHRDDQKFTHVIVTESIHYLAYTSFFAIVFVVCSSPRISSYLHLTNIRSVCIVSLSVIFSMISVIYASFLQAHQEFEYIAGASIFASLMRVIPGYIAVSLGRGLYGAIGAVTFSSCCSLIYNYYVYRYHCRHNEQLSQEEYLFYKQMIIRDFRQEWKSIVLFCLVGGASIFIVNADIFIVQHLFVGETAGNYTAISVLSKFLLFFGTALESVYYPQLAKKKIGDICLTQLRNYIILSIVLIAFSLLGTYVLGRQVLYLYKSHLVDYHILLMKLIIVSGGLFFCTSFIKLLVARRRQYIALGILFLGTIGMIFLHYYSYSIDQFVTLYMSLIGFLCMIVFISLLVLFGWRKYTTQ